MHNRIFVNQYGILISKSAQIGDIGPSLDAETIYQKIRDEYLKDSTVTVVLIGAKTWKRKHVDWEIGSSIRQTKYNSCSGLLGIILPRNSNYHLSLYKNVERGYADLHHWNTAPPKWFRVGSIMPLIKEI